ncbi:unnamed protein product [Scytosiphon promiscuus]
MMSARRAMMIALLPVGATFFVSPPHASRAALMAPEGTRSPRLRRFNMMRLGGVPVPSSEESSARTTSVRVGRCCPGTESKESTVVLERDGSLSERYDGVGGGAATGSGHWRPLLTVAPLVLAAATAGSQASMAAVTGGRIGGGGYTAPAAERTPSAPPMQQQQRYKPPPQQRQYQPRAGRDIYGSEGSRFHVSFDNARGGRRSSRARFNPDAGDIPSSTITPGDVAMVGGVSATIAAVQRYNRKRFLEEETEGYGRAPSSPPQARARGKGREPTAVVTTLQLSLYCDRKGGQSDVLATLDKLSQTADVNSGRGLSTLVNEVCLALLRSDRDWIGGTGGIKSYPPDGRSSNREKKSTPASRAKRDFNRAVMRERSKWERETVSNTPDRGFSSSTAPSWGGSGGSQRRGTYAVATLMVAWAELNSTPPKAEPRKSSWFSQDSGNRGDSRDGGFSIVNRESALRLLEWIGDEAAEGRGENVLDVEVLWTPADPEDSLDRDDLDAKWPELIIL